MYVALGFLGATLLALALLPALNRRAERLAKRRMEAVFPLSIDELNAEKDHLRAEFAVTQRKLEQALDDARLRWAGDRQEMGRRAIAISDLERQVEEVKAEVEARARSLAVVTVERNEARAAHETQTVALSQAAAALGEAQDRLAASEAALSQAMDDSAGTNAELGSLRVKLSAAEIRIDDLMNELRETAGTLASERETVAALKGRVQAEAAHGEALIDRIHSLEALRDEQAARVAAQNAAAQEASHLLSDAAHQASRREEVIAERDAALAHALGRAKADKELILQLQDERDRLRAGLVPATSAADGKALAELSARIDEVADALMKTGRERAGEPPSPRRMATVSG